MRVAVYHLHSRTWNSPGFRRMSNKPKRFRDGKFTNQSVDDTRVVRTPIVSDHEQLMRCKILNIWIGKQMTTFLLHFGEISHQSSFVASWLYIVKMTSRRDKPYTSCVRILMSIKNEAFVWWHWWIFDAVLITPDDFQREKRFTRFNVQLADYIS